MIISDIITEVDKLRPGNKFTTAQKIDWISNLDAKIHNDIIVPYSKRDERFYSYKAATDKVIASDRYMQMYINYVVAQIDYYLTEYSRFNNGMVMFNNEYSEFERDFIRTHRKPRVRFTGL